MNTPIRLLPPVVTALLLLAAPLPASPPAADRAAELLATQGSLPLEAAGPYVARGSYRLHVAARLGRPDATLPDGTWIYHERRIADSAARGSLLVRFDARGRVGTLHLGTPAHVAALERHPSAPDRERLARR
jgi:hypothetical protein